MKYLRKFETEADVSVDTTPNIVLVEETKQVFYNVAPKGVSIQHINGQLYSIEYWIDKGFTSDLANGVAVIDDRASFVISKNHYNPEYLPWGGVPTGVLITEDETVAATDYNGEENTKLIVDVVETYSHTTAAQYCSSYTFPNGVSGYMPAYGEWKVANEYTELLNEAFAVIDGKAIGKYFTSTLYSSKYAWKSNGSTSHISPYSGGSTGYSRLVRAFTKLYV